MPDRPSDPAWFRVSSKLCIKKNTYPNKSIHEPFNDKNKCFALILYKKSTFVFVYKSRLSLKVVYFVLKRQNMETNNNIYNHYEIIIQKV